MNRQPVQMTEQLLCVSLKQYGQRYFVHVKVSPCSVPNSQIGAS